jgi:uncharacterized protein YjbI with pentapeptide repeats/tetratricopeptide (TPR) repeat protein
LEGADVVDHLKYDVVGLPLEEKRTLSLRGRDLKGAILVGSSLKSVDFTSAILQGADFSRADLRNAKFCESGASTIRSNTSGRRTDAKSECANLEQASFLGANLEGAHLEEADVRGASFWATDLKGAYLDGADLQGSFFLGADLQGASLAGAHLQGANLVFANLQVANLTGADLEAADLRSSQLQLADLSRASLLGASLDHAELQGAWLDNSDLKGAGFEGANLEGASLRFASVWRADIRRALLQDTIVEQPVGDPKGDCNASEGRECPWSHDLYLSVKSNVLAEVPHSDVEQNDPASSAEETLARRVDPDSDFEGQSDIATFWSSRSERNPRSEIYTTLSESLWKRYACTVENPIVFKVLLGRMRYFEIPSARKRVIARALLNSDCSVMKSVSDKDKAVLSILHNASPDIASAAQEANRSGLEALKRQDYESAKSYFLQAVNLSQYYVEAHVNLGDSYARSGAFAEAIAAYDEAIKIDPSNGDAFEKRGTAYFDRSEYDQAIADFGAAMQFSDYENNSQTLIKRGLAWRKSGYFEKAIDDFDNAMLGQVVEDNAFLYRGLAYASEGLNAAAASDIYRWIARDKNYNGLIDIEQASNNFDDIDNGTLKKGFSQILMSDKYKLYAWYGLGLTASNEGLTDVAKDAYNRVLQNNPNLFEARGSLGQLFADSNEDDRAIEQLTEAIKADPKNKHYLLERGDAYNNIHDSDKALADFDEYVKLSPTDIWGYLGRESVFVEQKNYDSALKELGKAEKINADVLVLSRIGWVYYLKGDYKKSTEEETKALAKGEEDGFARYVRARAYFLDQDFFKAAMDLHKVNMSNGRTLYTIIAEMVSDAHRGLHWNENTIKVSLGNLSDIKWPGPIVELFLGHIPPIKALSDATTPEQHCEATYYIGEWNLTNGNVGIAVDNFNQAVANCPGDFFEYSASLSELSKLIH